MVVFVCQRQYFVCLSWGITKWSILSKQIPIFSFRLGLSLKLLYDFLFCCRSDVAILLKSKWSIDPLLYLCICQAFCRAISIHWAMRVKYSFFSSNGSTIKAYVFITAIYPAHIRFILSYHIWFDLNIFVVTLEVSFYIMNVFDA